MVTKMQRCDQCGNEVAAVYGDGFGEKRCRGCALDWLTEQQRCVLMAVRKHQPTTIGEVADECGYASVSSASHHLKTLRTFGFVTWTDGAQNTITELVEWPQGERA